MTTANDNTLIAQLQQILPEQDLIQERESLRPYECDALSLYRELPRVVALPETATQVQEILRLCHRR